jgi:hypothetical protein
MLSINKLETNNLPKTTRFAMCAIEYNNHNIMSVVSVHLPSTTSKSVKNTPSLLDIIYELPDDVILLGDINATITSSFDDKTKESRLDFYDKTKNQSVSTRFLAYEFPFTNIICDKNAKSMNVKTRLVTSQCGKAGVESGGLDASDNCILFERKNKPNITCNYSSAFKAGHPLTKLTYGSNEVPSDHAVANIVYTIKQPEQIWKSEHLDISNISMNCMSMNVGGDISNEANYNLEYIPVGYEFKDDEDKKNVLTIIKSSYDKIIDYEKSRAKVGIESISIPSRSYGILDTHTINLYDLIEFFKYNDYSIETMQKVYQYAEDQQNKYDKIRVDFLKDYPDRLENLMLLEEAIDNIKENKELRPIRLAAIKSFVESLDSNVQKMTQLEFIKSHLESKDYSIVSLQEVPFAMLDSVKVLLESHGFTVPDWHVENNFVTFVAINSTNIEPFIKEVYEYSYTTI